jgi:hypothetical protein
MNRRARTIIGCVAMAVIVFLSAGFAMLYSQTKWRAEWEHGIALPASATDFQCRGDAYRLVLDRGASTGFVMGATDLQTFKSELTVNPSLQTFVPENSQYQGFTFPWGAAAPTETLDCDSPNGDWLHVELYPVDSDHVGVWMYTDWN